MRAFLLVALSGLAVSGCGPNAGGIVCTEIFAHGVTVTVTDADANPILSATLTLTEGDYTEAMQEFQDGSYEGAGERAGTYTLTVEADGFITVTIENIVVDEDACHVIGVVHEVSLIPS